MAESRDRLGRAVDIVEVFARRRSGPLGILSDESMDLLGSPVRQSVTRSRNLYRSTGRENASVTPSPFGRGRGRGTGCNQAIERRRARLGDGEGQIVETPILPHDETILGSNISSVAQLEHNFSTPASTTRLKPCPASVRNVSKILLNVTNQKPEESSEETPRAKKAERQNKVRTLMSMRLSVLVVDFL
ncbi:protein POLYCHOME-like [Gossypium australe]|uniref:Protein POLYCHOME-like n=1 Tax=Gossypium australe TaxID=47621 RepID=A0A5B6VSJ0_9ROSI|nr:protein POLYCHOME-like [Gossypium australe]